MEASISAHSKTGPSQALAAALHKALARKARGGHTDIFVRHIHHTPQGWHVDLEVLAEMEKKKKEKAEEEMKERQHALHEQNDLQNELVRHRYEQRHTEEQEEDFEFTALYIELSFEDIFKEMEERFDFNAVHFLPKEDLKELRERHPDLDLYRAAHKTEDDEEDQKPDTWLDLDLDLEPEPEEDEPELVDE